MDIARVIARLRYDAEVVRALCEGVDDLQARWKPTPAQWSVLEVVCHLGDEEVRDFRTRLDLTLHSPGAPWPPIDPPRWAVEGRYNERALSPALAVFLREREDSVRWLKGLAAPDWSRATEHPTAGPIRAGDLLAAWVAHDLIHVRQINRLHRQYLEAELLPDHDPAYAGSW